MSKSARRFIHYVYPYKHWSAGLRAIHYYCHLMRKAGYDSYITTEGNPEWDTPIFKGQITDEDIVIYPEPPHCPRYSNPLLAKNIVRYFLYFPNTELGIIPSQEYCLVFGDNYFDSCKKQYAGQLTKENILPIPTIDPKLFYNTDEKTIDNVVFVGKGHGLVPSPFLPAEFTEITYGFPKSRDATAALLRSARNFYSFDRNTALLVEGKICGCNVYILDKDTPPVEWHGPLIDIMDYDKDIANVNRVAKNMLAFFKTTRNNMKNIEMKFTGERMVGKTTAEVEAFPIEGKRHVDRYKWAAQRLTGNNILDCACGVGYGSRILADSRPTAFVNGIDINPESIEYAQNYYMNERVQFDLGNMLELKLDRKFNTIVSLETIEHVKDPTVILNNFKSMMTSDSNLIVSIPTIRSVHFNHFHLWEVPDFEAGTRFFKDNGFDVIDSWHQDGTYGIFNLKKTPSVVDVVMLAWSKNPEMQAMTQKAIDSLHASTQDTRFQVFLMETAKGDIAYNGATVIQPNIPFNYNAFINLGLKRCKSKFVVMCNNDVVFHPGWYEAIERVNADSASPIDPDWEPHKAVIGKRAYGYKAGLAVCGWCIVAKKSVLDTLGKFDEQFSFYFQDCDFSVQLSSRKLRHVLVGTSYVTHLGSKSHELLEGGNKEAMTWDLRPKFLAKYPKFNEATCRDGEHPTICLTMIVKNEAKIIEAALRSVLPFIDFFSIVDTGSTDGTQDVIRSFFHMNNVPGELHERPWVNFGHNRTESMQLADGKADYMLVVDADDAIFGTLDLKNLTQDSYLMRIGTTFSHWRQQLFKSGLNWSYRGVLHEYAFSELAKSCTRLPGDYYLEARTAGARNSDPLKYQKDAAVLEEALKTEPENSRYWFYLGQSYFDCQNWVESKRAYTKRTTMGGYMEEVFYAQWRVGICASQLNEPEDQVMACFLKAYEFAPQRAESLHGLAEYLRSKGRNALAYAFAKVAAQMPVPENDTLFLFRDIYNWKALDEVAVNAYWMGKHNEAININTQMLMKNICPPEQRARIAQNLRFSAQKIDMKCPPDELHILRPGAIGDIIMTLWAVEAYAKKHPSHKIYYYCAPQYAAIPMMSKTITKVIDAELYPHFAKQLVGYPLSEGYPEKPMTKHLLEYFGAELGLTKEEATARWEPRLAKTKQGSPYITIQCKTGWSPYKEWSMARWQEIVNRIKAKYPKYAIIQIGAANEPSLIGCERANGTIEEAISIVAKAKLHLGGDSFPNHVRGLVNRPSVILWGSTSPVGSGYDCNVNLWHNKDYACSPCYREYQHMSAHPKPHCPFCKDWNDISHPCMSSISIDEVWVEVDKLLGGK